jgi:hypothetical protein
MCGGEIFSFLAVLTRLLLVLHLREAGGCSLFVDARGSGSLLVGLPPVGGVAQVAAELHRFSHDHAERFLRRRPNLKPSPPREQAGALRIESSSEQRRPVHRCARACRAARPMELLGDCARFALTLAGIDRDLLRQEVDLGHSVLLSDPAACCATLRRRGRTCRQRWRRRNRGDSRSGRAHLWSAQAVGHAC